MAINRFYVLFLVLCLCSCKQKTSRLNYTCDIDMLDPWTDHISIKKRPGYSGYYVSMADTSFPYCIGFKKTVAEITDGHILRAEISAWVNYSSETTGRFVCVVDSQPGNRFLYLDDEIKYDQSKTGHWQKMKSEFYLPKSLKPHYIIYLFLWNTKTGEILEDDIEINFTEY